MLRSKPEKKLMEKIFKYAAKQQLRKLQMVKRASREGRKKISDGREPQ